ncbi:MAG TPA: hypothetical protein VM689_03460 [Aliidongia sp.]|nr:hypothetical protein [Aliidongia sp.]
MAVYWISFRFDDDPGQAERRYALTKSIHTHKKRYWDRTDNFVIFESVHTLEFLADSFKRHLDRRRDLFLLCELATQSAVLYGHNTDPDVLELMPGCCVLEV